MEAAVSDILRSRSREPEGLRKTSAISLGVHAAVLGILAFVPAIMPKAAEKPRVVMHISLGGAPGPSNGGLQMLGGKNIQAAAPSEAPTLVRHLPPSVTPPKMTMPDTTQKPRTPPKPTVSSKDPKGTVTGRGFETQVGTAKVDTGAKGQGFGLSSGGGGGTGGYLDVHNFCCPEYIVDMINRVRRNWNQNQQATGMVLMKFTIQRNGQITGIEVEKPSGYPPLDIESQRALVNTKMLAPLPGAFPEQELPVHLSFEYERIR